MPDIIKRCRVKLQLVCYEGYKRLSVFLNAT